MGGSGKLKFPKLGRIGVSLTGGTFKLFDPDKINREFLFGAVGRGVGKDAVDDFLPFLKSKSFNLAPEDFYSEGSIYMLPQFGGEELAEDDFTGVTLIYEAAAGVVGSLGGTVMLLGGSLPRLLAFLTVASGAGPATLMAPPVAGVTLAAPPALFVWFIESFNAGMLITAASATTVIGGGVAGYLGYVTEIEEKETAGKVKPAFGGLPSALREAARQSKRK
jgi:hypothetical protein